MPKQYMDFDDTMAPKAKMVEDTMQLEPRTGKAQFESSNNTYDRYASKHGNLGGLGDRDLMGEKTHR
jgi:hypothetical protein